MKAIYTRFKFAAVIIILAAGICHAQTITLKPAPVDAVIDGNDSKWDDKLPYTGDNEKVSYTLANDKNNLYLVLKTKDTVLQEDILGSGITFIVDIKGKKSTTFPVNELENESRYLGLSPLQTEIKATLTQYRKINAAGFKEISDEQLSTANSYGIRIAMGYTDGYLVYEEALPLELLEKGASDKACDFTIKINGLEKKGKVMFIEADGGAGNPDDPQVLARHANKVQSQIDLIYSAKNPDKIIKSRIDPRMADLIHLTPFIEFGGKFNLAKTP